MNFDFWTFVFGIALGWGLATIQYLRRWKT